MSTLPRLFIGDASDSVLLKTLKRLEDEACPVKNLSDLALINAIRRINDLPAYTVASWNAEHFPSSSLH